MELYVHDLLVAKQAKVISCMQKEAQKLGGVISLSYYMHKI